MKQDINNTTDIKKVVDQFYAKVKSDETIRHFFNNMREEHWQKHLLVMYAFWENVLFHTGEYNGKPLETHRRIHQQNPVGFVHFHRWLSLFTATVDESFAGKNADKMKEHARGIAAVMQQKI